jgi:hypothetical protein
MGIRLIKAEEVRQASREEKKAVARPAVNDFMHTAQSWVEEFKARKSRPIASPFREEK